jgi:4-diphosphocytidyl-2-C-methyl-D-erythritol kinase
VRKALILHSPAKINLFLRILSRRDDGFHNLASLMQAVGLFDTLIFSPSKTDCFSSDHPDLPLDSHNLVIKALEYFRKMTGIIAPISIHLEKQIPMQAGLGGGSGNVATTLWGLNQFFQTGVLESKLRVWAGEISADAPFFFSSGCGYCTGIGECVESFVPDLSQVYWLVKPKEGLSTPEVFKHLDLSRCSSISPRNLLWQHLYGEGEPHNDLEDVAFKLNPSLNELKKSLPLKVWMTGSGTGFVCNKKPHSIPNHCSLNKLEPIQRETDWYKPKT